MLHNDAVRLIKNTFESAYDEEKFVRLINELFSNTEHRGNVYSGSLIPNAYKDFIKSYKYICKYVTPSGEELSVLSVNLSKNTTLERARTAQRNFIANYMKERGKNACLVAFYTDEDNKQHWRFSFVRTDTSFDLETFKLQSTITPAKRYSYMVGDRESSHTAQQQLCQLLESPIKTPELDDIEGAFAVEKVSSDFFDHYKELFLQLVENIQKIIDKDSRIKFEFVNKNISAELFCKKLMGQIVFLYFIQKKGWLGVAKDAYWGTGDRHFMRTLFETAKTQGKNYFNDFLEPLFYEALASERKTDGYFDKLGCRIPFLNGGLFEPISGYNWQETDIVLDNDIFSNKDEDGILDVFDRYNFTVREDEPLEKEIAVDPEMLGKVFENLLEIKDRKSKGAFYTPREIVHYMCQQSLIQYLNTKMDGKVDISDIEFLVRYGDVYSELQDKVVDTKSSESKVPDQLARIKPYAEKIDNALAEVKVFDPAIGSGAFPVGMMHEIIRTRQTLLDSGFIKADRKHTIYEYKRQIIRDSIYGVDIEESAVEIAKLRLWLSLVVDEDNVTNIKPLPNLDYKIVWGDSLTSIEKNILNTALLTELENIKSKYFDSFSSEKANYTKQMKTIISQLLKDENFDLEIYFSDVFKDKHGFDIVIGNPPYISALEASKSIKPDIRQQYKDNYKSAAGTYDMYILFFERGLTLMNKNGVLSFITPTKWVSAKYAESFRKNFACKYLDKIVSFDNTRVFDSAGVSTIISFFSSSNGNVISERYKTIKMSCPEKYSFERKALSEFPENCIGFILYGSYDMISKLYKNKKLFPDVCTINGSSAAAEADEYSKYITDFNNNIIKMINTGNNAQYSNLWGKKEYSNKKIKYLTPGLDYEKCVSQTRLLQYKSPKIIISKLTKHIVASLDIKGEFASTNTTFIYNPTQNYDLYVLCAILNSKMMEVVFKTMFSGMNLLGSMQVQAPQARLLPLPDTLNNDIKESIKQIVCNIIAKKQADENTDNEEEQLNQMIYRLYDLTPEEIAEVENLYPSTKGSKDE